MKNLNHKCILKLIDAGEDTLIENGKNKGPKPYLALEIAENGELFDYIFNGGKLDLPTVKYYIGQLTEGLIYLHTKGFAHRDLKLQNVLLDKDYNLKIADFGFAIPLAGRDGSFKLRSKLGTKGY